MGRTDLENALKGLDRLTHDEARMATAQVLKATYNVDAGVREVADQVVVVDDRVVSVDRRVQGVDERVANVDERVKAVDDKVAEVFDGARTIPRSLTERAFNRVPGAHRRKGSKGSHATNGQRHGPNQTSVISQATLVLIRKAHASLQRINYGRIFADGSPHQTHPRITTSRAVPIARERQPGSFKVAFSPIGRQPGVRCFGFMENVRPCSVFL